MVLMTVARDVTVMMARRVMPPVRPIAVAVAAIPVIAVAVATAAARVHVARGHRDANAPKSDARIHIATQSRADVHDGDEAHDGDVEPGVPRVDALRGEDARGDATRARTRRRRGCAREEERVCRVLKRLHRPRTGARVVV